MARPTFALPVLALALVGIVLATHEYKFLDKVPVLVNTVGAFFPFF
jgi:hypothetical protein